MTAVAARLGPAGAMARRPGPDRRQWPLARIFTVGAVVVALVAVAAVVVGALALARLADARSALLDVVAPANLAMKDLTLALVDEEAGARGFGQTGRAEYRASYADAVETQQIAEGTVRAFATGGGLTAVTADLDELDTTVARWRNGFAVPAIAAPLTAAPTPADTQPAGAGMALFAQVRDVLTTVQRDIDVQRMRSRSRLDDAVTSVSVVFAVIVVGLVTLLAVAAIGLRRGVLRPVSDLADHVRDVVGGEVTRPVSATGPREIVELGHDVEAMRVRILGDLDAAQEANRRLDEQTTKLARSNRDLEQFAYVASHDLQEPLRKVASFCQLLQRRYGGQLDDRADQYIAFAVDGAERMQQLINDLLGFSRVGRSTAGFTPVALADVVASVAAALEQRRAEVDGTIEVAQLPTVHGDASLLRQLFINMIGNGLKFHRGGVAPTVRVAAGPPEAGLVEVTVSDDGIGIEQVYADKVFVLFQRLHARDVYPGTGIGLALAKKIVEFHGGTIRLDAPGARPGATLRFTLPASEENP